MFKNKTLLFIIALVVILVLVKLLFLSNNEGKGAGGKGGPGKGGASNALVVDGIVVKESGLEENVFSTGTVLANEEVELRPEIAGKVVSIFFKEGTPVQKGALLVKLNDADYQAQLSKLQSNLKLMKEISERQRKLFELNGLSRQEYDEALNQVAALESDINFTKAQIEKTEIRAPFSGQVGLKNVSEGSFVNQNFLIATVQQLNPVKIDFSLPEKYSRQIKSGHEVVFTVEGDTTSYIARVFAIEPKVDAGTRSVKVRAMAENTGNKLIPGSFAKVNFTISRSGNALLIPTQTVIPVLKGKKVMVSRNGMAISQNITTGIRKNADVQVLTGLQPGDTVITTGLMQLRDSMKVEVKTVK